MEKPTSDGSSCGSNTNFCSIFGKLKFPKHFQQSGQKERKKKRSFLSLQESELNQTRCNNNRVA